MKTIISTLLLFIALHAGAQYIGVKAKYTGTRTVPNPGHNDTRENRLVLCFYNVDAAGVWTPISVSNYDMYFQIDGVQVVGNMGALDSIGSNYPGYAWTAPVVAAYYNTLGLPYWYCSTYGVLHQVANGHELDCGFLKVSEWVTDYLGEEAEQFTTIEVALPWYDAPDPFYTAPGNVNFQGGSYSPGSLYNLYTYNCGGPNQLVRRGPMWSDTTSNLIPLAVHFGNLYAELQDGCRPLIKWSNLTETDIDRYVIERATGSGNFISLDSLLPTGNTGGTASYAWQDTVSVTGVNLYRIKAIENSGRSIYSMVLRVNGCSSTGTGSGADAPKLSIYPNPAQNGRFVLHADDLPKGKYQLALLKASGQFTRISEWSHDGGPLNKLFDLGWMQSGFYTVLLQSSGLSITQKLMISN